MPKCPQHTIPLTHAKASSREEHHEVNDIFCQLAPPRLRNRMHAELLANLKAHKNRHLNFFSQPPEEIKAFLGSGFACEKRYYCRANSGTRQTRKRSKITRLTTTSPECGVVDLVRSTSIYPFFSVLHSTLIYRHI